MWGCGGGGILLFSPTVRAGSGGGERRDTHRNTHRNVHANVAPIRCFPLEPFFEINPGILCSGIGS